MSSAARPSRRSLLSLAGLGLGAGALAACGENSGATGGETPTVVTTCYAMDFLISRIAEDRVELISMASPGADMHGLELSVRQVMEVQEADLVPQIPGFQLALDDAIASQDGENVLDVSSVVSLLPIDGEHYEHASDGGGEHAEDAEDGEDGEDGEHAEDGEDHDDHDHGPTDPHFWHDPLRMADVGDAIAARLAELVPEDSETFTAHAQALRTELEELDEELGEEFDAIEGERTFITSHAAYAYLADRYDLHQVGIAGVDPEVEPSPQRLLALEEVIHEEDVTTVFFETTASPRVAQTLADNVGVSSEELDNLETQLSEEQDYPQVMRENCRKLIESWT